MRGPFPNRTPTPAGSRRLRRFRAAQRVRVAQSCRRKRHSLTAKHFLDEVREIDILDANAGCHGQPFATNFNPEINIREVTAEGRYWEGGQWRTTDPLSVSRMYDFPEGIGPMKIYLLYHEELESIAKNFPSLKRARFWMTFSEIYLTHLRVLGNVGMTASTRSSSRDARSCRSSSSRRCFPTPALWAL